MSRDRLERKKGRRRISGSFGILPHQYFQSPEYATLTARAVKLLIDVYCQYRGRNNGDLCASWTIMQERGWSSKSQLAKGLRELEETGWIVKTRQGSINKPSLYAVTFQGIDYCGGKLDAGVTPDSMPLNLWRLPDYKAQRINSKRAVRKKSPDLDTGEAPPHGGSIVRELHPNLPRTKGRSAA